jgi:predicted RNase H-like HicB family nuclease
VKSLVQYIGLIHKEAKSDFGVSFPDFPGCITAGGTLDEARAMAGEALALHIEGMSADGDAVPEPSSLQSIMDERENRDGVAILVEAPPLIVKTVRVNITLPQDILTDIDRYSEDHGLTRSGFLAKAAMAAMKRDAV